MDHAEKVITNDDISGSSFASFGGLFYFNTGAINDCDANCFDQVRLFANRFDVEKNPNWRREVLQQKSPPDPTVNGRHTCTSFATRTTPSAT